MITESKDEKEENLAIENYLDNVATECNKLRRTISMYSEEYNQSEFDNIYHLKDWVIVKLLKLASNGCAKDQRRKPHMTQ